jgi:hypothetical protein
VDEPGYVDQADEHLDPQVAADYDAAVADRFSPDVVDSAVAQTHPIITAAARPNRYGRALQKVRPRERTNTVRRALVS